MEHFSVVLVLIAIILVSPATAVSQAVPHASFSLADAKKPYAPAFGDTIPPFLSLTFSHR